MEMDIVSNISACLQLCLVGISGQHALSLMNYAKRYLTVSLPILSHTLRKYYAPPNVAKVMGHLLGWGLYHVSARLKLGLVKISG